MLWGRKQACVLVFYGCCVNLLQLGGLKQHDEFSHTFGGLKSKVKVLHCLWTLLGEVFPASSGFWWLFQIRSVQFSHSVVSDSLRPHESQHARPPCPSPTPRVHSDSRPSSQGCHPAISASVVPFSYCPQYLPVSESFPMSQLFT